MPAMAQRFDVAVVGAGPAGASTAQLIARLGLDVALIERCEFPRSKACGEYLSAGTVRILEQIGVASELSSAALCVDGIETFGPGAHARLRFTSGGWSLPRATLDAALLAAARNCGARVIHARAEGFARERGGVRVDVRAPSGEITALHAKVLVGADGAHSLVAREFGLTRAVRGPRRFALGGHYAGVRGLDRYVRMFVDGATYFAVNPLSPGSANAMLIVDERELRRRRGDVDAFMRERAAALTRGRIRLDGMRLETKRIAIGPLAHSTRGYCAENVLLTGDAAHFLDPFTGQGVYLALRSGQLAARAIFESSSGVHAQRAAWRAYEKRLGSEIARRKRLCALVSFLVRFPPAAKAAAALFERDSRAFRPLIDAVTS